MSVVDHIKKVISPSSARRTGHLEAQQLQGLARMIATTRGDEIGCDACWNDLDRFVEMELDGKHPEQAMPLVADHLSRCRECREEYEALLDAVRALS